MKKAIKLLLAGLLTLALSGVLRLHASASFNQNRIIDDIVFDQATSMSADQIDSFLNSFPNSCLSTSHGFSSVDPTGYSFSTGFTYGGPVSAGHVIYDASQAYGLNPQVLLATLQKEEGLVRGDGPYGCSALALSASVGYGCPDSGSSYSYSGLSPAMYYINGSPIDSVSNTCVNSAAKAGFSQQLIRATWLLKFGEQRSEGNINWAVIKPGWDNSDDPQSCYGGPMTQGTWQRCPSGSTVFYDGYTTIDGTAVHMDNGATAALYWYTPHFSGNQSFYDLFTGWFGPTVNPSLYYAVIQGPDSSALYLQTSAGKYYIPSGAIMQDWGLDKLPIQQVSQFYLDSLETHDWVGHLLKDDWGNMFMVEGGKLHYVRSGSYLTTWGLNPNAAVQSLGIAYTLPGDTWAGRFVQDAAQPNSQLYLLDKGQKRAVPDVNMLFHWRYTQDQLTTVSLAFLNSLPTGDPVTQYASDGSNNYLIDSGRRLSLSTGVLQDSYFGTNTAGRYDSNTLSYLPSESAGQFVAPSGINQWFMLEGGRKHYIPNSNLASVWGKKTGTPLTTLSQNFMSSLPDGGNLVDVVQSSSPSMYWLIDGSKHYLPNSNVANAWLQQGVTPPVYSSALLNSIDRGPDASTTINVPGSPYDYMLDNATRHYLTTQAAQNAWGGAVMSISSQLLAIIPEGSFINYLALNSLGQPYLLMNSVAYAIDPNYKDAWGVNQSTPVVSSQTIARYTISASTLQAFIKIGSTSYVMTDGSKIPIRTYSDAYQSANLGEISLPNDYFNSSAEASFLVSSTDGTDKRIWLINQGKKTLLSFEQAVTYGYLSRGIQPTRLTPATLGFIPDATGSASLLIQTAGTGVKFLSFGVSLGMPDSDTLTNYVGSTNPILQVSPSVFAAFNLTRSTSRLIVDDFGNYYWMESGTRRHIVSGSVLDHYRSTPVTYLQGTTMQLIPLGANLTQ